MLVTSAADENRRSRSPVRRRRQIDEEPGSSEKVDREGTRPLPTPSWNPSDLGSGPKERSNLLVDAFAAARVAAAPQYHSFENFHVVNLPSGPEQPQPNRPVPTLPPAPPAPTLGVTTAPPVPAPPPPVFLSKAAELDSDDEEAAERERERMRNEVVANIPKETKDRLADFVSDGMLATLREFDMKSLSDLIALPLPIQEKVLDHVESQKVFLLNSRSKSGFLVSVCERARQGALDCRGLCAKDPWKDHLSSVAIPKRPQIDLIPEQIWLRDHGAEPVSLHINITSVAALAGLGPGVETVSLTVSLTETVRNVKHRLAAVGVEIPVHKMKIRASPVGFLNDTHSLAFYNLVCSSQLQLFYKTRAGVARKKDQSDGFDPHFCEAGFLSNVPSSKPSCCSPEEYFAWATQQTPLPTAWPDSCVAAPAWL